MRPTPDQDQTVYAFGNFRLDGRKRQLWRDGEIITVAPKVFDTLLLLVENPGRVISKNEMMERLWPDTFVVDNNLKNQISALRKALGESPENPFIETIPKRGYKFVADVVVLGDASRTVIVEGYKRAQIVIEQEDPSPATLSQTAAAPAHWMGRLWRSRWVLLSAVGLLVIATALWKFLPAHGRLPEGRLERANFSFFKVLGERGDLASPRRFSPDGALLAFTKFHHGQPQIYVSQVDGERLIPVTPDGFDARTPVFSPDGRDIAFISSRGQATGVWVVNALGGPPRPLPKLPYPEAELLAWGKSGRLYFKVQGRLLRLAPDSQQIQEVFSGGPGLCVSFAVSPDESRLAFAALSAGQLDIWVASLGGDDARKVTDDAYEDYAPVWFPDSQRLAYSSKRHGDYQVCIAYLDGSSPAQVTLGDMDGFVRDVSPDGRLIAFESTREESHLFALDLASGREAQISADYGFAFWPQVSPDGGKLLYQEIRNSTAMRNLDDARIMVKDLRAAGEDSPVAANGYEATFSPDGKTAAFVRRDGMTFQTDIYLLNAEGGAARRLTTGGINWTGYSLLPFNLFDRSNYCWSPDSQSLAFGAAKDGVSNLWLMPTDGRNETKLTRNADTRLQVASPIFLGNGLKIAYLLRPTYQAAEAVKTWQVRFNDGEAEETVFEVDRPIRLLGGGRETLFFAVLQDSPNDLASPGEVSLMAYSLKTKQAKELHRVSQAYLSNIFLSLNAGFIALVTRADGGDNVYLLSVSDGSLRRLSSNLDPRLRFNNLPFAPDGKTIYFGKQQTWSTLNLLQSEERKKPE